MKTISIIFILSLLTGCANMQPTGSGGTGSGAGGNGFPDPTEDIYFGG